jgi:hypothetical protein
VDGSVSWASQAEFTAPSLAGTARTFSTNDLPGAHNTGVFPIASTDHAKTNAANPNSISAQSVCASLRATPQLRRTPQIVEVADVAEAKIVEGLGVDQLRIVAGESLVAQLKYTRRERRGMTRLHRKLERLLPSIDGAEKPPDWLDNAERIAEVRETCTKCGNTIPTFAEGVCPRCQQTRKILWRLLDVAKPYRRQINITLALTMLYAITATLPAVGQRYAIDYAIQPKEGVNVANRVGALALWVGLIVLVVVINEVTAGFRLRILSMVGTKVTADLRHMVYAHMHDLSLRYFAKRRTGSLITRVRFSNMRRI